MLSISWPTVRFMDVAIDDGAFISMTSFWFQTKSLGPRGFHRTFFHYPAKVSLGSGRWTKPEDTTSTVWKGRARLGCWAARTRGIGVPNTLAAACCSNEGLGVLYAPPTLLEGRMLVMWSRPRVRPWVGGVYVQF